MYSDWQKKYNLLVFNEIDSTNLEAKRLSNSLPDKDFVITAKTQTAGRGRYDRSWTSLSGNIHMSILLQATNFVENQAELSFVSALSVLEAIENLNTAQSAKLDIALKWPNDVMVSDKKIAGILLESVKVGDKNYLVIGIGINLESSPYIEDKPTTSLKDCNISYISIEHVLDLLMNSFEKYLNIWHEGFGFSKIRNLWLERAYKLGELVTIGDNKNRISGIFEGIAADGSIILRTESGDSHSLCAGEIFFGNQI